MYPVGSPQSYSYILNNNNNPTSATRSAGNKRPAAKHIQKVYNTTEDIAKKYIDKNRRMRGSARTYVVSDPFYDDNRTNDDAIFKYRNGYKSESDVQIITRTLLRQRGHFSVSLRLFYNIVDAGIIPDPMTYNIIISVCAQTGQANQALALLKKMKAQGVSPDIYTYNAIISALMTNSQYYPYAVELIKEAIACGFYTKTLGYNQTKNEIDFHCSKIFSASAKVDRDRGIPVMIARAVLEYHYSKGNLAKKPQLIVGQNGDDKIKSIARTELFTRFGIKYREAPQNKGRLIIENKK